jgi:IMP dehydrogenase/GMP reductase
MYSSVTKPLKQALFGPKKVKTLWVALATMCFVHSRGEVKDTIQYILGGIRSCMTYIGAKKLKDIPKCTTFVRVNRQLNTIYNNVEI